MKIQYSLRSLIVVAILTPFLVWLAHRMFFARQPLEYYTGSLAHTGRQDWAITGPSVYVRQGALGTVLGMERYRNEARVAYLLIIKHGSSGPYEATASAQPGGNSMEIRADLKFGRKSITVLHKLLIDDGRSVLVIDGREFELAQGRCFLLDLRSSKPTIRQCPLPRLDPHFSGEPSAISRSLINAAYEECPEAKSFVGS